MAAGVVLTGPLGPANLLANLALPGGLALTCTASYLPVFDMVSSRRNLECIVAVVPFSFFTQNCKKKKKLQLNHQYYTNSIFNSIFSSD